MTSRDRRVIGGVYRIGQVIKNTSAYTICTAYDRNTNDVVGLTIIELPPQTPLAALQQLLGPLEQRRALRAQHIIRIHRVGIEQNHIYVATDPLRGVSLQHIQDHENIDLPRALELIKQIALGVKVAHTQKITGLDLRPFLITVDTIGVRDRVQIDDIGLRSLLEAVGYTSDRTDQISYLDPRYLPPEYIHREAIGPWSDIYQLGLLLYLLVTGRLPFVGRTPAETGVLQSTSPVPRITQFAKKTPGIVQDIIDHAMEKDPKQRFTSIQDFISELEVIVAPTSTHTLSASGKRTSPQLNLTMEMARNLDHIAAQSTVIETQHQEQAEIVALPNQAGSYAYLLFEDEESRPQRIGITGPSIIVGRLDPKRGVTPDLDLSEFDPKMSISRQHARIRYEKTFFSIEDLKSRNKTRLNGRPLIPFKAERIKHGDHIHLGSVPLRFEVPGMQPLSPLYSTERQKRSEETPENEMKD